MSGCLNIDEFTALVEWRFEKPNTKPMPNDSPCGNCFEECDLDGTKVLEAEEIVMLMKMFTKDEETTSEDAKALALELGEKCDDTDQIWTWEETKCICDEYGVPTEEFDLGLEEEDGSEDGDSEDDVSEDEDEE